MPTDPLVIGGGPIGLEFAQMFSRFGVQVVVLERSEQPLPREDRELAVALCAQLSTEGIRLEFGTEMRCGDIDEHGKHIHIHGQEGQDEDLVTDQLLVAVGRRPALDTLNLDAAGVQYTGEGITTHATLHTDVPRIWASGDNTSKYQFTHVASDHGKRVAHNMLAQAPQTVDDRVVTWVTFTDPELNRAITNDQTFGSVKLLADLDGKIHGGHILGANAGDLMTPVVYAIRYGLTIKMIAERMLPYPTMAEAVRWAAAQL